MNEEYVLKESVYELTREFFCLECKFQYGDDVCPPNCSATKFMDAVFDLPVEDVRENVRGEWEIECQPDGTPYCLHCSVCDKEWAKIGITSFYDYCPNCGADMRKCGENS